MDDSDLLYRFRASFQKKDGTVEIRQKWIKWWQSDEAITIPFTTLEKHEVSPKDHKSAMLKLTRTGDKPVIFTILAENPIRAYAVLLDAKATISTIQKSRKRKLPAAAASNKKGRTGVTAAKSTDEERRRALLAADSRLAALFKDLVGGGVIDEATFWARREEPKAVDRAAAVSNDLWAEPEAVDDKLRYKLTTQKMDYIFRMYPAVKRAYDDNVPRKLTAEQFWVKYFQSRYYARDKGAAVNAARREGGIEDGDDLFARYDREEESRDKPVRRGVDLAKTQADRDIREDDEPPEDDEFDGGPLAPRPEFVVHKLNNHGDLVVHDLEKAQPDYQAVETPDLTTDLDKPKDPILTKLDVTDHRKHQPLAVSSKPRLQSLQWSPSDIDLARNIEVARSRATHVLAFLDRKSRPPADDKPPAEPFKSQAEAIFDLTAESLRLLYGNETTTPHPRVIARLSKLAADVDAKRADLRQHNADFAIMLKPLADQLAFALVNYQQQG